MAAVEMMPKGILAREKWDPAGIGTHDFMMDLMLRMVVASIGEV
jgi:hypothetical protein